MATFIGIIGLMYIAAAMLVGGLVLIRIFDALFGTKYVKKIMRWFNA